MTYFTKISLIMLTLLATSCANISVQQSASKSPPTKANKDKPPRITSPFEKETLYELLVAEFANKRGRKDLALGHYQKQAHITRDAQVTARATQLAQQIGAQQAILDTSTLWIDIDPSSTHARVIATLQLMKYKQYDKALDHIDVLLELNPTINYEQLLRDTARASGDQRSGIIMRLNTLTNKYPNNPQIWMIKAVLENISNLMSDANNSLDRALSLQPSYTNAILFKSALMEKLGKAKEALAYLDRQSQQFPADKKLGLAYSKALAQRKDHPKLISQLESLAENFPNDGALLLTTAQVAYSNKLFSLAKKHLNQLINSNLRTVEANGFLARIAANEEQWDVAISHLRKIKTDTGYSTAQIQIAAILQQQNKLEDARETLRTAQTTAPSERIKFMLAESELLTKSNQHTESIDVLEQVLTEEPNNTSALYMQAMVYAELRQYDKMETGLRRVLELQPANSAALNALGYTLADQNDRLEEATHLIERAYKLAPNDPAIIDSLGWLKYRTGDNDAALALLKKAYALFKDQEIAAHLGELLWVTGKKEDAQTVWNHGLKLVPDSKVIRKAIDRLVPDFQMDDRAEQ